MVEENYMEIKRHICFTEKNVPQLLPYLKENNIAYKIAPSFFTLDIYESSQHWGVILDFIRDKEVFSISETVFSKQELKNAEWLSVRSKWRFDYPQPENAFGYESVTYTKNYHCQECGVGLVQVDSFRMKKMPVRSNRHFLMLNWVDDELFVSEAVKQLFQNEGISGITFRDVKDKTGSLSFAEFYQLNISSFVAHGLQEAQSCIRAALRCQNCGAVKYHPNGRGQYIFNREIFENVPDIVKTSDWFGWGHSASHLILVRQSVYQLLKANHLERGLIFEPIKLL